MRGSPGCLSRMLYLVCYWFHTIAEHSVLARNRPDALSRVKLRGLFPARSLCLQSNRGARNTSFETIALMEFRRSCTVPAIPQDEAGGH